MDGELVGLQATESTQQSLLPTGLAQSSRRAAETNAQDLSVSPRRVPAVNSMEVSVLSSARQ
jgi:hypothetical protein